MSIYSSEKLSNVYELSQVVSQNSSRSNWWLFFDFSLYQLEHQNILYATYNLMKKTIVTCLCLKRWLSISIEFSIVPLHYNKLKGRADSSPNLEIINLFYEADVKMNDLFYNNAYFFTAVVFNLVCFTVFFASWLVFFYENILLPISRCFLGKNAFSQWLLNER